MKSLFLTPLFALLLIACGTSQQSKKIDVNQLKTEVMAVHDEVMPKMGELRKLEKELRHQAAEDSSKTDFVVAADRLAAANDAMMQWMRGFNPKFEGSEEEVINYLTEQKNKIDQVKENMLGALEEGNQLTQN